MCLRHMLFYPGSSAALRARRMTPESSRPLNYTILRIFRSTLLPRRHPSNFSKHAPPQASSFEFFEARSSLGVILRILRSKIAEDPVPNRMQHRCIPLKQQHGIAITEKAIALKNGDAISFFDYL
jgi:hypothetical protein